MEQELREISEVILSAKTVAALTGAGVSKESGIPTFRDRDGLWSQYDMEKYASIQGLLDDPVEVWKWYRDRYMEAKKAQPNRGHIALAELEKILTSKGKDFAVITQNIDGLHRKAGSENVIEIHGSLYRARCMECGRKYPMDELVDGPLPPYCECGGLIRPDVVFFGEPLPDKEMAQALNYAEKSDVFMVLGTSAVVYPAAMLPYIARDAGAVIVEVNIEDTSVTEFANYVLRGEFEQVMPSILKNIKNRLQDGLKS
jgi:NAD-dependent deacetylase